MQLLSYDEFLFEKSLNEWNSISLLDSKISLLQEVSKKVNESEEFVSFLIEGNMVDEFFSDSLLNENLIDKWKEKFQTAKETLKDKGKEVLSAAQEKIIKIGQNIGGVIKLMLDSVKEGLMKFWEAVKSLAEKGAGKSAQEIKDKVEKMGTEKKNQLAREVKEFSTVAKSGAKWALGGFLQDAQKSAIQVVKDDEVTESIEKAIYLSITECIKEGSVTVEEILEGGDHGDSHGESSIPFLSTIAHKLGEYPPFSYLHKIQAKAAEGAENTLNRISIFLSDVAGAPGPFTFPVLAYLVGTFIEFQAKGLAKSMIKHAIPGLGTVLSVLSNIAKGIAIIGIIEAVIKTSEEGKEKTAEE
jgi:DNA-binding ferritin-like protein (Dps family)